MPLAQVTAWAAPAPRGERRLELGHRRPQDEAAILQDTGDGGVDIGLEAPVLRAEVDECDGVEVGVSVGR